MEGLESSVPGTRLQGNRGPGVSFWTTARQRDDRVVECCMSSGRERVRLVWAQGQSADSGLGREVERVGPEHPVRDRNRGVLPIAAGQYDRQWAGLLRAGLLVDRPWTAAQRNQLQIAQLPHRLAEDPAGILDEVHNAVRPRTGIEYCATNSCKLSGVSRRDSSPAIHVPGGEWLRWSFPGNGAGLRRLAREREAPDPQQEK